MADGVVEWCGTVIHECPSSSEYPSTQHAARVPPARAAGGDHDTSRAPGPASNCGASGARGTTTCGAWNAASPAPGGTSRLTVTMSPTDTDGPPGLQLITPLALLKTLFDANVNDVESISRVHSNIASVSFGLTLVSVGIRTTSVLVAPMLTAQTV